jgi:hypothetical protein
MKPTKHTSHNRKEKQIGKGVMKPFSVIEKSDSNPMKGKKR